MQRKIAKWYIDEPEVLHIIVEQGYRYIPLDTKNWYESDYPIEFNGADGFLRSRGTQLTCLSNKEIEAKELEDFDRRLGK